jgi:putative DNA primase/helicase
MAVFHCSHAYCINRGIKDVMVLWGDADSFCSANFKTEKANTPPGLFQKARNSQEPAWAEAVAAGIGHTALPQVQVNDKQMRDIAAEAWAVLTHANEPPSIFQWGHLLVDIINDDNGQPLIRPLKKAAVKGTLARMMDFVARSESGIKPARPPSDVVDDMMSAKEIPLPVLLGIIRAPVFAPTGVLATESGYQPATRFYLQLSEGLSIPEVPTQPDAKNIQQDKTIITNELLVDFPFTSEADLAHAIACLLLPFTRPLIHGPTPCTW